uniref:Remodeling and spacing factor 1 n=1 Tax=Falco tinnunculus TaxID=100819 RepID=A0A8C4TYP6_FALTI
MAAAAAPPAPSPPPPPPAGPCCPGSWPNFAVVCSFLERYGALLDLPELPFPELERVLQPPQEPGDQGERPGDLPPTPALPVRGPPGGGEPSPPSARPFWVVF